MNASEFLFNEKIGREEPKGSSLPKTITIRRDSGRDTFTISVDGETLQSRVHRDKIVQFACFEANLLGQPVRFVTEGVFDEDPTTFNNKWEKIK